jgi:hypothetical protein
MTYRPRHPKPDANQVALIADLLALGFEIVVVASLGGDALDLFVQGYHRRRNRHEWLQVEVKTDRAARFTNGERAYFNRHGITDPFAPSPYPILAVTCAEDVARWFGL